MDSPRLAALALMQQRADEGVEFSAGTAGTAVGVLVGSRRTDDIEHLSALWRRQTGRDAARVAGRPLFLRCDFEAGRWTALTVYVDRQPDLPCDSPLTAQPLFCGSLRQRGSGEPEMAAYFDLRHRTAEAALSLLDEHLQSVGWAEPVRESVQTRALDILPLGWLQYVAVTGDGGKAKLDLASGRLPEALDLIGESDRPAAQRLAAVMRRLGGSLGYVGAVFSRQGALDLRLYGRAFPCTDLPATVARLGG